MRRAWTASLPWVFTTIAIVVLLGTWEPPPAHGQSRNEAELAKAIESTLGLTREERRLLQSGLATAGFNPGPIDGILGRRSRAAIGAWQSATGRVVTGYLDAPALEALLSLPPAQGARHGAAELRRVTYDTRIAAAEALEHPRRRATALLALVLELAAQGDLAGARSAARRIEDPKRRARAFERIRRAQAGSITTSGAAPPPTPSRGREAASGP